MAKTISNPILDVIQTSLRFKDNMQSSHNNDGAILEIMKLIAITTIKNQHLSCKSCVLKTDSFNIETIRRYDKTSYILTVIGCNYKLSGGR